MALSESTLKEIRAELGELHRVQLRVEDRIKALEAILTPFDFSQFGLPFQAQTVSVPHHGGAQIAIGEPKTNGNGHGHHALQAMPLRPAILSVLEEVGPARAQRVAAVLAERGYPTQGKTRFSTRVYNDLWRMANASHIDSNNGEFSVKK